MKDAITANRIRAERAYWIANQAQLFQLAQTMPLGSGRSLFTRSGCIAMLLAIIAERPRARQDILDVMGAHRYSFAYAGMLLSTLSGDNPDQHLWHIDCQGRFYLHRNVAGPVTPAP